MGDWIVKNTVNEDWVTLLLLCNFMLISIIKFMFKDRFRAIVRFYDTALYLSIFSKEKGALQLFNVFFGVFSLINFSLLIHLFLVQYHWLDHQFIDFMLVFGSVFGVIVLRSFINIAGGKLLDIHASFENYTFLTTTYFFQSAFFLFFSLVLYQFALPKTLYKYKLSSHWLSFAMGFHTSLYHLQKLQFSKGGVLIFYFVYLHFQNNPMDFTFK